MNQQKIYLISTLLGLKQAYNRLMQYGDQLIVDEHSPVMNDERIKIAMGKDLLRLVSEAHCLIQILDIDIEKLLA